MCLQPSKDQGHKKLPLPKEENVKSVETPLKCESKTDAALVWKDHFSSLLFGGSWKNTVVEHVLLALPFCAILCLGSDKLDVSGSMSFREVAVFFVVAAVVRRIYNAYLEAVYFTFPQYRIQPPREHKLKKEKKDLCGREMQQLETLEKHDTGTLISQAALNFTLYFALPGFYPDTASEQSWGERFIRLILNHYVMSFGMYWAHRACHEIPYLWEHIHSIHHWAKHPLSRNTYEDHWFDNFANAILGHGFAQILIPLDRPTFWFSHLFRILESLEKHSGVSCGFNLAHSFQQWLPFAQMPHHHNWHHEGFKGSNYTFSSIGGLWDCAFGTRKPGRFKANDFYSATRRDHTDHSKEIKSSTIHPMVVLGVLTAVVAFKLMSPQIFPDLSL